MAAGQVLAERSLADGRSALVAVTDRTDGDLRVDGEAGPLLERRRAVTSHPWTWLRQVHAARVVRVTTPGEGAGSAADAAVTAASGAALAVHTADCAPVGLIDAVGAVGVAHVGWRGLVAGVLGETVRELAALGGGPVTGVLGPCIRPGCYEFGENDLATVVEAVGSAAVGVTDDGRPALDLPAAVVAGLAQVGVREIAVDPRCTSCDPDRYSHRARQDTGRQALVTWIDP